MGSRKRSRKTRDSDSDLEDLDDMENDNLMMEEEMSDDYDDDDEEEDGESEEEKENDKDAELEDLEKDYEIFEPVRSSFCDSDEGVRSAYSDLITSSRKTLESLLGLQEALLEKNPSISQSFDSNSAKKHSKDSKNSDMETEEEWWRISQMHSRITPFRDKSIDKWQRKTRVTTGAAAIKSKLQAFNQDISEQVASYMRDPSRMTKQMQLSRSTVGVFGTVLEQPGITKGEEASPDGDPELLDDSEFYQQLLKEFFETIDPSSSETAFYALKKLRTKKRKLVDRRASKSRKIRYNVHEKIVNFMAPRPMDIPPMAPKLFENLFGLKTQRLASAV
ncbi:Protein BFR2, putative [Ricinus communis]|uniref:Protein BFR2, putative n=1 Tax=Ricinus communis TaxID=3988 RepID=B9RXU7_RICCO|nr:Protein BFR2, putative [Ricinus communis]